jgi:hypothetical protein
MGHERPTVPRLSWTLFGFMHALSGLVVLHSLTAGSFVTFLSCCKPNLRGEIIASRGSEATADLSDLPNRPPNHHHHSSHVCRQNPLSNDIMGAYYYPHLLGFKSRPVSQPLHQCSLTQPTSLTVSLAIPVLSPPSRITTLCKDV